MYSYDSDFTNKEKQDYIDKNCKGNFCYRGIQFIDNDSTLSYSQKEELKNYLRIWGD